MITIKGEKEEGRVNTCNYKFRMSSKDYTRTQNKDSTKTLIWLKNYFYKNVSFHIRTISLYSDYDAAKKHDKIQSKINRIQYSANQIF